jgi:20S proteasome alpha/beta subunit
VTVAIGLVCSDGVIVASDSMGTAGNTARPMQKVFAEKDLKLVWTAAGMKFVIEEIEQVIDDIARGSAAASVKPSFNEPNLNGIRDRLGKRVSDRVKMCYEAALPYGLNQLVAPQVPRHAFASDFLFLGWANKTPWFLEIAGDGQMNWHTAEGFAAVGSGGEFAMVAQALMKHHIEGPITVDDGLLIAYRAIETTCQVSSHYVGLPVRLAVVTDNGARILDGAETDKIRDEVEGWRKVEADTLVNLRAAPDDEEPQSDLPTIEPENDSGGIVGEQKGKSKST